MTELENSLSNLPCFKALRLELESDELFLDIRYFLLDTYIGFANLSKDDELKTLKWHTFYPLSFLNDLNKTKSDLRTQFQLPLGKLAFYKSLDIMLNSGKINSTYSFNNVLEGNFNNDFIKLHNELKINAKQESVKDTFSKTKKYLNNYLINT